MEIVLRPFTDQDAAAFAQAVNESLPSLQPWMVWAHEHYSEEEARQWFRYCQLQRQQGVADELGLFTADGRLLGGAGIRYPAGPDTLPALGYWVRSSEQRQGVASQAVNWLAKRAFAQPDIAVIEILAAENNLASRAVAVRCGAELVDIRYGLIVLDAGPVNTAVYHLLRPH